MAACPYASEAVGDGGLEDRGRVGWGAGGGELVQKSACWGCSPEVIQIQDAAGDGGGGYAEYGLCRA